MEWLIVIGIIIAIVVCVVSNKKNKGNTNNSPYVPGKPFYISVNTEKKNVQGTSLEVFTIKGRGQITAPFTNYPVIFVTTITDVTDKENKPIISTVGEFRIKDNMFFAHTSGVIPIPYMQSEFRNWIDLLVVPIDLLVFPRGGMRKLKFKVTIAGIKVLAEVSQTITYNNQKPGYEELIDEIKKIEDVTVKISVHMCGVDGDFDDSETKIIKDWIEKKAKNLDGSVDHDKKTRLTEILNETIQDVKERGAEDLLRICDEINEVSSAAYKYEIIDLLIKITSADGVYKKEEQDLINKIASKLEINMERVRSMIDKMIDITTYEGNTDIDSQLGLKDNMTVEEKKKQLREEYRKWNQQAASNDEKIRKQANEMLEIIAKKRAELK